MKVNNGDSLNDEEATKQADVVVKVALLSLICDIFTGYYSECPINTSLFNITRIST